LQKVNLQHCITKAQLIVLNSPGTQLRQQVDRMLILKSRPLRRGFVKQYIASLVPLQAQTLAHPCLQSTGAWFRLAYQLDNVDMIQAPMYLDLTTYLVIVQGCKPLFMVHLQPQAQVYVGQCYASMGLSKLWCKRIRRALP
jgi:hypothetical protein